MTDFLGNFPLLPSFLLYSFFLFQFTGWWWYDAVAMRFDRLPFNLFAVTITLFFFFFSLCIFVSLALTASQYVIVFLSIKGFDLSSPSDSNLHFFTILEFQEILQSSTEERRHVVIRKRETLLTHLPFDIVTQTSMITCSTWKHNSANIGWVLNEMRKDIQMGKKRTFVLVFW